MITPGQVWKSDTGNYWRVLSIGWRGGCKKGLMHVGLVRCGKAWSKCTLLVRPSGDEKYCLPIDGMLGMELVGEA